MECNVQRIKQYSAHIKSATVHLITVVVTSLDTILSLTCSSTLESRRGGEIMNLTFSFPFIFIACNQGYD